MKNNIKAIPTRYNGVTFRSRLEARWALVFDRMNIDWQYEPEGFQLGETWYVPDFLIFDNSEKKTIPSWIEIKPQHPSDEEIIKALLFAKRDQYSHLTIIYGTPGRGRSSEWGSYTALDMDEADDREGFLEQIKRIERLHEENYANYFSSKLNLIGVHIKSSFLIPNMDILKMEKEFEFAKKFRFW